MRRNNQPRRRRALAAVTLVFGGLLVAGVAVRLAAQSSGVTRVSVTSSGVEGNADSFFPALSADGRIVGFKSLATNFDNTLPDQQQYDVFVHDRESGQTTRVSITSLGFVGNDNSLPPALDDSGDLVAFASEATNMVPNDTNGGDDVFVRNRIAATTEAVSLTAAGVLPAFGGSRDLPPSMSADGRFVAFETTAILTPNDPNTDIADVYVRDRQEGVTELISVRTVTRDPQPALAPAISRDGCNVVFVSPSDRLIPQGGDPNEKLDLYVRNRCADPPTTQLITRGFDGSPTTRDSQGSLFPPGITDDGALVAFESFAINLVPNDTNNLSDVFVFDRGSGKTERVSVNSYGDQGDGASTSPSISGDGRYVVFVSNSTNFVAGANGGNVYVRDRQTNETCQVSLAEGLMQVTGDSVNPTISRDGRWIAFESTSNLVPGGTPGRRHIYVVENSRDQQVCPEPAAPTVTPVPPTNTPGPNDCCQCEGDVCELPSDNHCPENCEVVFQAACAGGSTCVTFTPTVGGTPTPTPGENDCCQCEGDACEAPGNGTCPESCSPVFQAACAAEGCITFTPTPPPTATPSLGPNDCCACEGDSCDVPSDGNCPNGCDPVYDAACIPAQGCVANTPTPSPGANDCCSCEGDTCSVPANGACPEGCTVDFNAACLLDVGCVDNTPTPTHDSSTPTPTSTLVPTRTSTPGVPTSTPTIDTGTPTHTPGGGTPTVTRTPTSGGGGGGGGGCGCETNPQPRSMGAVALRDLVALFGPMLLWRLRRRSVKRWASR